MSSVRAGFVADGSLLPQRMPALRDFVTSAGFGGAAALWPPSW